MLIYHAIHDFSINRENFKIMHTHNAHALNESYSKLSISKIFSSQKSYLHFENYGNNSGVYNTSLSRCLRSRIPPAAFNVAFFL